MLPTPNHELPKPQPVETQSQSSEYVAPYPEQLEQVAPGERLSQANQAVAQASAAADPVVVPLPTSTTTNATDDGATIVANPALADDTDVIEKEWVEKAKTIVAKTKTDPHQQSLELTNFKHDYMKKRYGKEIKLPVDRSAS